MVPFIHNSLKSELKQSEINESPKIDDTQHQINPGDEHIFKISCYGKYSIVLENRSSTTISAHVFIDEGVPVLVIGNERTPGIFLGLENKDQTVIINDCFFQR